MGDCDLESCDFHFELYFVFSVGQERTGLSFSPNGGEGGGGGKATGVVSGLKSTESNLGPRPNPEITL